MNCTLSQSQHDDVQDFIDCIEDESIDDGRLPTSNLADKCSHHMDMNFEGYGTERIVFSWDSCVVKISRHIDDNQDANNREIRNWKKAPQEAKKYLVPIEDSGNNWLTMKLYDGEVTDKEHQRVKQGLNDTGFDIGDLRKPNAGKRDGEVRFFDYGSYREIDLGEI